MMPLIVKKSPIVIVKRFIGAQALAALFYFLTGSLIYYARIYRNLGFGKFLSFELAEIVVLIAFEIGLIFFLFLQWYKDFIVIKNDKLVRGKGLLFPKRTTVMFQEMKAISYQQTPLGRLTKYGTVAIEHSDSKRLVVHDIPEPGDFAARLTNLKYGIGESTHYGNGQATNLQALLTQDEHENLEFKTSFRWDMTGNKVNKNLERVVMKTIAAFMNTHGGRVVLGVNDTRNIIGLAADFATLGRKDQDGFENHFSNIFATMIGAEHRHCVRLSW
ncbi:MAG: putative DNA binding domain-containing protein, partial [Candidatus Yanofskybacteria bacterium]|nr:putative DNA binding domain-containing protein [Candidatus Yanofskybacteria bacterium]